MSAGIKLRLAAFVLAIAFMVALITWTAQSSWRRVGELRDKLTTVQIESFKIADHIQESILELNNNVLRYGLSRDTNDWVHFNKGSQELDEWIDKWRPKESTDLERLIHDHINTNYDFYMAAAHEIAFKVQTNSEPTLNLSEFANFETQSQKILKLGYELAEAHRQSLNSFLASSSKALGYRSEERRVG